VLFARAARPSEEEVSSRITIEAGIGNRVAGGRRRDGGQAGPVEVARKVIVVNQLLVGSITVTIFSKISAAFGRPDGVVNGLAPEFEGVGVLSEYGTGGLLERRGAGLVWLVWLLGGAVLESVRVSSDFAAFYAQL
jgi:hypothetical protein